MSKGNFNFGLKTLKVKYSGQLVGILAMAKDRKVAFSYDSDWLKNGFSISPFSLPLENKVFVPSGYCFDGLFGVFADSLPDAWGRLLLDRMMKEQLIEDDLNVLDRLAIVGKSGMGALEYEPDYTLTGASELKDLDYMSEQCKKILTSEYSENLDALYQMGGSSGGARPKILTCMDGKEWMIKFPAHTDSSDCGLMEYTYSECAKKSGIHMSETRLFPSKQCKGYFGTVRFDRVGSGADAKKIHMVTAAALLEADFRAPCLDYHALMKLTRILTRENREDMENMFRRACFNVYAHNRDDHAKNFAFLYNENEKCWRLSPAYDLTYSNTYFGEHTTSVDGNGKNPGEKELLKVGMKAGLNKKVCTDIISEIREVVSTELETAYHVNINPREFSGFGDS
jgi:serine/threonine-protein kinase HipA